MAPVVPSSFLFRFSVPVAYREELPRGGDGKLLDLPEACRLPEFAILDGQPRFGELRLAWNHDGLGISVHVTGKRMPLHVDASRPAESDGLAVWLDTRDTKTIHRAGRFCHQMFLLPSGGGKDGDQPQVISTEIARAREVPRTDVALHAEIFAEVREDGYLLEAWLPVDSLTGFDPQSHPRLGFAYQLIDSELGEQFLTVGTDFPITHDPSMWATLELQK